MRVLRRILVALAAVALIGGGTPTAAAAAPSTAATHSAQDSARVAETRPEPRQSAAIAGGTLVTVGTPGQSCRVSFTVTTGFVTAGGCGTPGATVRVGSVVVGSIAYTSLAYTLATTLPTVTLHGWVANPGGQNIPITGSNETSVGGQVCRVGHTTGYRCGTIQAKNQSVSFPEGSIHGVTRTNVCAEPGDVGGLFLTGSQAQGIAIGGSGNCSSGGTTFFLPVNPILSAHGLSLVTS
ncbi:S1 family peptidase [Actinoalloteichus hymeniacidonis]|uniref:Streptogrisin C n=1 Tax=Actinoalloteichus hymeniacidonis TaxID=340345 RepID=A0AAC9MWL9_9PSEU|nr:S1 family peptidase [Actinoalloteichus hymeniacidonis]AOS61259.1 hypothetical protein TL08_02105 [Actinoalloteichus hymeniacidonis]MBB5910738.1 streptogrisin C [Actinoalloteichus hymeniacidonis]